MRAGGGKKSIRVRRRGREVNTGDVARALLKFPKRNSTDAAAAVFMHAFRASFSAPDGDDGRREPRDPGSCTASFLEPKSALERLLRPAPSLSEDKPI